MPEDVKEVTMDTVSTGKKRRRRTRKTDTNTAVVEKDKTEPKVESAVDPVKKVKQIPVKVVLAPAKPKILLVPKTKIAKPVIRKTFRAKRIQMVIDNSPKTQTRRRKVLTDIDTMTDEQVRATAVASKIYTKEAAAKLPVSLLKMLMKDVRMMKGQLV
jgi:hypothetical protein